MAVNLLPQASPQNHAETRAASKPDDAANADPQTFSDTLSAAANAVTAKRPTVIVTTTSGSRETAETKPPRTTAEDVLAAILIPSAPAAAINAALGTTPVGGVMPAQVGTASAAANQKHVEVAVDPGALLTASLGPLTQHMAEPLQSAAVPAIALSRTPDVSPIRPETRPAPRSAREPLPMDAGTPDKGEASAKPGAAAINVLFAADVLHAAHEQKSLHSSDATSGATVTDMRALNVGPTTPPVQVAVATPAFTPAWRDDITQHLTQFVMMRQDRAEIRLHPADLGPISVHIEMDGSQANLLIQAPQAATRDGLELALPQLRDSLAQQGITLGEANVRDQREPDKQAGERALPYADSTRVRTSTVAPDAPVRVRLGLIDLFA